MESSLLFQGMIKGLQEMGATFVKADEKFIYFNIPKGSEIDNEEKIQRAKEAFQKSFSIGLKIKKL